MMPKHKTYHASLEFKADADETGQFLAEFATLGVVDHDGDVTLKGAFTDGQETLIEAWNHNYGSLPVGKGVIRERDGKAVVEGQFFLDTAGGLEHYRVVKALGPLQEWSYTFEILDSEYGKHDGRSVRYLKKLDVWGVAPVQRGAGIDTRTVAIKSGRTQLPSHAGEADVEPPEPKGNMAMETEVKEQVKTDDEEALRRQIMELSEGLDFAASQRGKGGAWSQAFMAGRDWGRKDLLTPSGIVAVPSLASYIPAVGEVIETVLQAIPHERLSSPSVKYLREVQRTHAATAVALGAKKPTSTYELVEVVAEAQTIAHLSEPIPRQWLSDVANLRRYLDEVLRQGLELALEDEILNGSGVAPHLEGLLQVSGHLIQEFDTDRIVTCRKALTALETQGIPASRAVFVLHPYDWEAIELMTVADGQYMLGAPGQALPVDRARRQLWGTRVTLSTRIAEGTGLAFDLRAVRKYEREQVTLSWSENVFDASAGATDFERNLTRWRAEGRWALAVFRPAAIVEIELSAGS